MSPMQPGLCAREGTPAASYTNGHQPRESHPGKQILISLNAKQ